MIRHEYGGCATCHTDPSGAGILTPYGRAQSELVLSTQWKKTSEDEEPGAFKEFLFGIVKSPDWLQLQGWVRNGYLWNDLDGTLVDHRILQMRADLGAHVALDAFRATATVGYNIHDSAPFADQAWVTGPSASGNLVAREYWAGASLKDDTVLVRGGRLNLPFGLRNIEHTTWVRSETRTDINQGQQHGAAVAYSGEKIRAEIMGIAGNFQIHPDAYRERGYSAYIETVLGSRYTLGASSLITHASADITTSVPLTRQAHGIFTRLAPIRALAILAEADLLVTATTGGVGFVQADIEPIQGVHGILTGELLNHGGSDKTHTGLWVGAAWFIIPHVDIRVDAIRRTTPDTPATMTYLMQGHFYL